MKIRKAKLSDIKQCLELEKLDKGHYWTKKDFEKSVKDKLTIFLVAEEEKEIVGYILGYFCPTKTTEVMIHETRVSKTQRHKKIGTKLVNEFCKFAFNKGAKEIYAEIKPVHERFYIKSCKFKRSDKWVEVKKQNNK